MSTVLEVKDLCKTYITNKRQNNILKNVSFNIQDGEMVAVMGPSGSGKSTLLYCVSGMDDITAGSVQVANEQIDKMNQQELANFRLEKMGFIFQQMHMLNNLTIFDNILLPAVQSKENKKSKREKNVDAKKLMHKLSISEIAENDITEVSGGQLQRACICRSLINSPKILFADEPTGALNRSASDDVMKELTKINNDGTTIMLVTHDAKIAAKCSRVIYIVDGNIKGEINLGKVKDDVEMRNRTNNLNNWLSEMGW